MAITRPNLLTNATARSKYAQGVKLLKAEFPGPKTADLGIPGPTKPVSTYDLFVVWHHTAMMTMTPPTQADRSVRCLASHGHDDHDSPDAGRSQCGTSRSGFRSLASLHASADGVEPPTRFKRQQFRLALLGLGRRWTKNGSAAEKVQSLGIRCHGRIGKPSNDRPVPFQPGRPGRFCCSDRGEREQPIGPSESRLAAQSRNPNIEFAE